MKEPGRKLVGKKPRELEIAPQLPCMKCCIFGEGYGPMSRVFHADSWEGWQHLIVEVFRDP